MSSPEFDKHAATYEQALESSLPAIFAEDRYFSEYKVRRVARFVKKSHKKLRVFDYGCGIGRSLAIFAELFPDAELWGFDPSELSLAAARDRVPSARLTKSADLLPKGEFDVVFAANVFHHIRPEERAAAILQCAQLLNKAGQFFIFEHNPFNPVTQRVFERCAYDKGASMLRLSEVLTLARIADLHVVRSAYTLFFPRPLYFLRPLECMLEWLPIGAQYCVEMAP